MPCLTACDKCKRLKEQSLHGCVLAGLCLSAETLSSHGHRRHGLEWRDGGGEEGGREAEPHATVDGGDKAGGKDICGGM